MPSFGKNLPWLSPDFLADFSAQPLRAAILDAPNQCRTATEIVEDIENKVGKLLDIGKVFVEVN